VKRHFVEFFSPGTFVAESTVRPVEQWDVVEAMEMARSVEERHGATPYGFRFITRERKAGELDSHVADTSAMFFLGGKVLTLRQVEARNDPSDKILISNMKCNDIGRVVQNDNSYRSVQPLRKGDEVLSWTKHA